MDILPKDAAHIIAITHINDARRWQSLRRALSKRFVQALAIPVPVRHDNACTLRETD